MVQQLNRFGRRLEGNHKIIKDELINPEVERGAAREEDSNIKDHRRGEKADIRTRGQIFCCKPI